MPKLSFALATQRRVIRFFFVSFLHCRRFVDPHPPPHLRDAVFSVGFSSRVTQLTSHVGRGVTLFLLFFSPLFVQVSICSVSRRFVCLLVFFTPSSQPPTRTLLEMHREPFSMQEI